MNSHYEGLEEIGRDFKYLDLTVVDGICNVIVLILRYIIKIRNETLNWIKMVFNLDENNLRSILQYRIE